MNKSEMSRKVQILMFLVEDVGLYLDTHPTDAAAIKFFEKYNALCTKTVAEYEQNFGPITINGVNDTNYWSWIEQPWPWEMEA